MDILFWNCGLEYFFLGCLIPTWLVGDPGVKAKAKGGGREWHQVPYLQPLTVSRHPFVTFSPEGHTGKSSPLKM